MLVEIKTAAQIEQEDKDRELEKERLLQEVQGSQEITSLASHVRKAWDASVKAKQDVEKRMYKSLRQRDGEYEPSKLQEIRKTGGSEIFMRLTDEKCTAAKAWLTDILLPANDKPWSIDSTPIPELQPEQEELIRKFVESEFQTDLQLGLIQSELEVEQRIQELSLKIQEKANELANKLELKIENKIEDVLEEGNWTDALSEVISDVVDFQAGILKGPILRTKSQLAWGSSPEGKPIPQVQEIIVKEYERVSPFDLFPGPSATNVNDSYLCQRHRLSRSSLQSLVGVEGYDKEAIEKVLSEYGSTGLKDFAESQEDPATGVTPEQSTHTTSFAYDDPDPKIEAIQFWGSVQGKLLKEWGLEVEEEIKEYETEVWLVGNYVIKAVFNESPLGQRPYYKASFRERNGSFWGDGLPDIIRDIQDMVNAAARNLVNNMAISSGPQVGVDVSRLAEGENPEGIRPWRIWQFSEDSYNNAGGRQPLWFFQPDPLVNELLKVYEFFSAEADNKTGIPKYTYGNGGGGGALGTATGISMMMSNASRGIKHVVTNVDRGIIKPSVENTYYWLMLNTEDPDLHGDIQIVAKGSSTLIVKEQQQVRRNEFLNLIMQPIVAQIIGPDAMLEIIKKIADGLEIDVAHLIPDKVDIMRQQMMSGGFQPPQATPPQVMPDGSKAGGGDVNLSQQGRM